MCETSGYSLYQDLGGGVIGNGFICHTPHKAVEHTHAKILVNTLKMPRVMR